MVLEVRKGKLRDLASKVPVCLAESLNGSEYEIPHPREDD